MAVPVFSMTGFGGAQVRAKGVCVRVEVRTVNSRYLRIQSKLPDELAYLAGPAEDEIRKAVRRGSVTLTAQWEVLPGQLPGLPDESALRKYFAALKKLARSVGVAPPGSILEVLSLPWFAQGVGLGNAARAGHVEALFRKALNKALQAMQRMRQREGSHLARDFRTRIRRLRRLVDTIGRQLPKALSETEARFHARVNELLARRGVQVGKEDIARETVYLAERTDITEEIDRVQSHLAQAEDLLAQGGEIGRQLDFLTQEMFREASTMAAKVATSSLAQRVLQLRVEADRLKEQAQNIE